MGITALDFVGEDGGKEGGVVELPGGILAAWVVISFVLALAFFRWDRDSDR